MTVPALNPDNAPRYVVVANGDFPKLPWVHAMLMQAYAEGVVVCCDGAVHRLREAGFEMPHLIVGDLDSLSADWKAQHPDIICEIKEQDTNDLSKTFRVIRARYNPSRVLLLGATGLREDHTLGNLSLLPHLSEYMGAECQLITLSDYGCFYVLPDGEAQCFEVEVGQQVSLFALHASCRFTTEGLHWELADAALSQLWMGTLNRADKHQISVIVNGGAALIYLAHEVKKYS